MKTKYDTTLAYDFNEYVNNIILSINLSKLVDISLIRVLLCTLIIIASFTIGWWLIFLHTY